MYKVLMLSRYARLGASSRLRSYQYVPYLESRGFEVTSAPLLSDDYLRGKYDGNVPKRSVLKAYWTRLVSILRARWFDVVWVEKELLPWIPGWIELGLFPDDVPLVMDLDDALFHLYDDHRYGWVRALLGNKIDAVMRRTDLVVAGNEYLGERARQAGARRIELLPTVVDVSRYAISADIQAKPLTIGWIGSPSSVAYLHAIENSLREMIASRGVRVVAIGAYPHQLRNSFIEVRPWSESTEVAEIQQLDIGIMPLPDDKWERGKCGYKLVQYMACGKPVVASPVGVNSYMVRQGVEGFLAATEAEWTKHLGTLCDDAALRQRMGAAGRARVEAEYSLQVAAPRLEQLLRSVVKKPCAD